MPTEQFLLDSNMKFDAQAFNWIGRVSSAVEMVIVWHTVPVNRIEDVRTRETIMGGTGPASSTVMMPYLLNNLAGMKFKVITGFNGTTEIALAMERGEVEGSATPLESLTSYRADWVRDKKIKILLQYTAERDPEVADIPTMVEMGRSEEARQILRFYASGAEIGRSIVAPPNLPAGDGDGAAARLRHHARRPAVPGRRQDARASSSNRGPERGCNRKSPSIAEISPRADRQGKDRRGRQPN